MKIHLEGMGVMGALTAYQLAARNIEFTWHDLETPEKADEVSPTDYFTAWHASTGAIFPTGSEDDLRCMDEWYNNLRFAYPNGVLGIFNWVYGAKVPPHGAKMFVTKTVGHLKVGDQPSMHVDAQKLVRQAREDFASSRLSTSEGQAQRGAPDVRYLVSHGWGERQTHVYWGWTRLVKLNIDPELPQDSAFYFRRDRFFIRYAYPVGDSGWWYAGSTITKQNTPQHKPERLPKEYANWKNDFEELTKGLVTVGEEGPFIEGWRPAAGKMHDTGYLQYSVRQVAENVWEYPCRSHDGIRRFPDIWHQVAPIVGAEG